MPRGRAWVAGGKQISAGYMAVYKTRGKGQGTGLDLYFAREDARERPLLLFHHIRKSAGTSIRHLLHANYNEGGFEVVPIGAQWSELGAWHRDFWESLGERRNRLLCAASHHAGFLFDLAADERQVEAFTILREPVDRALSNYYHFTIRPRWRLPELYERIEERRRVNPSFALRRPRDFFNGAARSFLAPYYDTAALPLTAGEPEADLWRERLFDVVETTFLVGAQELFEQSTRLFAEAFSWPELFPAKARVNRERSSPEELSEDERALVRAYNWLDAELHEHYLHRLGEYSDPAAAVAEYRRARARRTVRPLGVPGHGGRTDGEAAALRLVRRAQAEFGRGPAIEPAAEEALRAAGSIAHRELAKAMRAYARAARP
jgi:hypothetical protein